MPVIPTTAYGTAEGVLNAARALVGDARIAAGTFTQPTISWPAGVPTNSTASFTPAGTNSAPGFTGTAATLTGSVSGPGFTGTAFDPHPGFTRVIFCQAP